tara:strand:+ start:257 stop:586 length:330 start_codon:yes stop_codon:yes gene_type:complete
VTAIQVAARPSDGQAPVSEVLTDPCITGNRASGSCNLANPDLTILRLAMTLNDFAIHAIAGKVISAHVRSVNPHFHANHELNAVQAFHFQSRRLPVTVGRTPVQIKYAP